MSANESHCHHELHVTVHPAGRSYQDFLAVCTQIGVRGYVMTLVPPDGPFVTDWMTGSGVNGSDRDAIDALVSIADDLAERGWDPVRVKIEAAPWHYAAPSGHGTSPLGDHYWESHVGVWVPPPDVDSLAEKLDDIGCYLSVNALKPRRDNGDMRASATCRSTKRSRPEQELQALMMRDIMRRMGLDADTKVRTEFTWLDMAYEEGRYGGPPITQEAAHGSR